MCMENANIKLDGSTRIEWVYETSRRELAKLFEQIFACSDMLRNFRASRISGYNKLGDKKTVYEKQHYYHCRTLAYTSRLFVSISLSLSLFVD